MTPLTFCFGRGHHRPSQKATLYISTENVWRTKATAIKRNVIYKHIHTRTLSLPNVKPFKYIHTLCFHLFPCQPIQG